MRVFSWMNQRFWPRKNVLGRTEMRMHDRKTCQSIRTVWDISRHDRARIATCSLRTMTDTFEDRYKENDWIDFVSNLSPFWMFLGAAVASSHPVWGAAHHGSGAGEPCRDCLRRDRVREDDPSPAVPLRSRICRVSGETYRSAINCWLFF